MEEGEEIIMSPREEYEGEEEGGREGMGRGRGSTEEPQRLGQEGGRESREGRKGEKETEGDKSNRGYE